MNHHPLHQLHPQETQVVEEEEEKRQAEEETQKGAETPAKSKTNSPQTCSTSIPPSRLLRH